MGRPVRLLLVIEVVVMLVALRVAGVRASAGPRAALVPPAPYALPRALAARRSRASGVGPCRAQSEGRASAAVVQQRGNEQGMKKKAEQALDLNPPKGTRDVYPADMRLRQWLFGKWRDVARRFAFEEYDAPVLENEALYVRKSGEEVTQQLYGFEDKGGRRVSLRPEMTPSLARMVMARRNGLPTPIKWFSLPQCWRYERMTRGRRREHYQWNMDIWGVSGVEAEAELLAAIVSFFQSVGVTSADVGIRINSRSVLSEVLTSLGVPAEKHAATCVVVDKLEKVPMEALKGEIDALGLDESIISRLLETMKVRDVAGLRAALGEDCAAASEIEKIFTIAESYGYADWLVFDASVVRGLAYYTGIVFEAFDKAGSLRAICGGGRYDRLLESFGGEPIPACGFGFGDAVIVELLKDRGLLPDTEAGQVDAVVFALGEESRKGAIQAASDMRSMGLSVDLLLEDKKIKWVFKHADRRGARFVCVLGADEVEREVISIKDLASGEQQEVPLKEASRHLLQQQQQEETTAL
jgi:histidyl-tRNA synthetase